MTHAQKLWRRNCRSARLQWGQLALTTMGQLRFWTSRYRLSVAAGEIQLLNGHWYVTHTGLLRIAQRKRCSAIRTQVVKSLCDPAACRWVFRAAVHTTAGSLGFVAYGDADPSNVSSLVHGAEMRVAETRAVNRALRKAYGIGLCSVDELGTFSSSSAPTNGRGNASSSSNENGSHNGQPRLRDRLCLLIRQYNLDPNLVKAYAAHFCGTQTIKEASRDLVESFISHLAASAKEGRDDLVCKLNSFAQPAEEVKP